MSTFRLLVALIFLGCATGPTPTPATERAAIPSPAAFADWQDTVLYFAVTDRFANGDLGNDRNVDVQAKGTFHGGDLSGLRLQLDEIAALGVSAIWITPVVRNIDGYVTGAGFPDWAYHGYWADDFETLDPRFGTESELKALVDDCHRRGIRVLLDVVYNHAGYGSQYLTNPRTREWLRSGERGTCGNDDVTTCVAGLPDFRTELPEVRDYLMRAHLSLARRVGADGFRLDTVKHVAHPFWQEHRRRTRDEIGADFFLLGEVWGGDAESLDPWFAGDEMNAGFDFSFQGSTVAWLQGRGRTIAFDRYLQSRARVRAGYHLAHFLSSHDVKGALAQLDGDRQLFTLAALLQFTTVGIPVVYYGEEVGRLGGDWPENRSDMPWGDRPIPPGAGKPRDESLRTAYRKLIAIRKAHAALSRGIHVPIPVPVSAGGDLLVFGRRDAGDEVIVAVNRDAGTATLDLALPAGWTTASDVWNDEPLVVTDGMTKLVVAPRGARIVVR